MSRSVELSKGTELWEQAQAVIPWGTQTNAKRVLGALADVMPAFIDRAEGCRIVDLDGREYIDYRSSLGPIILGHRHPAVDAAVRAQLGKGVLFSMASPLEVELAYAIRAAVPGAEMVRFLKSGGEAVAACVRLARTVTARDLLVITDYHGWQDVFASPGRPGVPRAVQDLTLGCPYGDREALARLFAEHPGEIAAVVTTPYDWGRDASGDFVRAARELTSADGALLVFDEVLTGFRLALGGGAEYFGVVPDLAAYAKALANGFPLAAFTGRAECLRALDRTIVTTTCAGETLSLAAALATLRTMREEPVHATIWRRGRELMDGLSSVLAGHGLPGQVVGLPPYFTVTFENGTPERDAELYRAFYGGLLRRGVFSTGPWLMSYAHGQREVEETLAAAAAAARDAATGTG
jgi:glutamate-1-semialdehyde aminotransferase